MTAGESPTARSETRGNLGRALRRALAGYQRRLNEELAAAGFSDKRFPQSRVLRMCSGPEETTISDIGRQLGVTRQAASKIVSDLEARGYLSVTPSAADKREKIVTPTARAVEYLVALRTAMRSVEAELGRTFGVDELAGVYRFLDALAADTSITPADYPVMRAFRWLEAED